MAVKPGGFLNWNPSGSNGLQPPAGQLNTGWLLAQKPPFQWMNWLFTTIDQWIQWFAQVTANPGAVTQGVISVTTTYSLLSTANGYFLEVNSSGGAFNIQLFNPSGNAGFKCTIKDVGPGFAANNVTLLRYGTEKIEMATQSYALQSDAGVWELYTDGTNWFLL